MKKLHLALAVLAVAGCSFATGCQYSVGGQTLPSPNYLTDDVQYFPAGPENQFSREASEQQVVLEDQEMLRL